VVVGNPTLLFKACRLPICDTAGCQPALRRISDHAAQTL